MKAFFHEKSCTEMFIAALSITTKTWDKTTWHSLEEWWLVRLSGVQVAFGACTISGNPRVCFQEFGKPDFVKHWIIGTWCKNKRNKYNSNFSNYFFVACSLRFWGALGFARWKLWAIILIFGCGLPSSVPFTVLPLEPETHPGMQLMG